MDGRVFPLQVVYADWVASSRALSFIENYINEEILPMYANTHTTSSTFGHQTSLFREEARTIIARTINARDDKDAVIFTGSGSTSAVNHLVRAMRLQKGDGRYKSDSKSTTNAQGSEEVESNVPVVFVGPHEHHSNLLPWRESICDVVNIPEDDSTGLIDLVVLENELKKYRAQQRPLMIGTFSAASNITGIVQETAPINRLLHSYGALAFWDFAAAAPYIKIDMNPIASNETDRGLVHMDAIFMSPHKFPGGVCTPGLLVAKKALFDRSLSPCFPGGGTVDFVTDDDQLYLTKISDREESGTPDIIGCIRAGLVFQLKHAVTPEFIESLEMKFYKKAVDRLKSNPRIQLMGPLTKKSSSEGSGAVLVHRLPTLSFIVYHQSGKMLHFNFVCALLDNLFGIQSRGGCVCAGPYAEYLLGMDRDHAKLYEEQLSQYDDVAALRPGFVRLSLNYFISEREADYVLDAIDFVAREGWKMLPEYSFQLDTNEWMHTTQKSLPNRKWLGEISYASGKMVWPKSASVLANSNVKQRTEENLDEQFEEARKALKNAVDEVKFEHREPELSQPVELMREDAEELRWFVYPDEAYLHRIDIEEDSGNDCENNNSSPLKPRGIAQNFHNPEWRKKWMDLCPLAPKYYEFHPEALQTQSQISSSLMPKTHRYTATVTDLDSALNAKSQYTARDMHLAAEENKASAPKTENGEKSEEIASEKKTSSPSVESSTVETTQAKSVEVHAKEDSSLPKTPTTPSSSGTATKKNSAKVDFVIPDTTFESAARAPEEEQERALEEAVFVDENEGLAQHKHEAGEEDDDGETCCPIVPGQPFVCPLPSSGGFGGNRTSVKTVIEARKEQKKQKRAKANQDASASSSSPSSDLNSGAEEDTSARDKRQSAEAAAKRKANRLDRYGPLDSIEQRIFKQMIGAIRLFDLIGPGDRVLVGVSGGKDSLTLLQMLLKAQKFLPFKFEVGAVTVDPQTLEFDPSPLKVYMAEIGVKYFYDSQPLISIATDIGPSSICSWCSRMKRGILHNICEREGYNVLALGQHLDDLVESFFMYSMHNGKLDTMKASSVVRNGKLKIVRPFVFVREKDTKHYANLTNLPVITENCPACFEEPKERARIKALLKAQERLYPSLFGNLLGAIKPLMHPDLKLDETLVKLDNDTKTSRSAKYYPKRRSEEDQAIYRAQRAKEKLEQAEAKKQARNLKKAEEQQAQSSSNTSSSS